MSLHDIAVSKHPLRTDKEFKHDYFRNVYQKLLGGLKDIDFTLLEVGVYYGFSMGVWREYFTKATIIGVEINPYNLYAYRPNHGDGFGPLTMLQRWWGEASVNTEAFYNNYKNCTIIYGDATKEETFKNIVPKLDVVIDDGSHNLDEINKTFDILYPRLNKGGMYIIEDSFEAIEHFSDMGNTLSPLGLEVIEVYDGRRVTNNPTTCIIALRKNSDI